MILDKLKQHKIVILNMPKKIQKNNNFERINILVVYM